MEAITYSRRERISVPIHGNRPLKIGLLRSLMKIAELEENRSVSEPEDSSGTGRFGFPEHAQCLRQEFVAQASLRRCDASDAIPR